MDGIIDEIIDGISLFLIGACEGLIAPVIELIIAIFLFAAQSASQAIQVAFHNIPSYSSDLPFINVVGIFAIFAIIISLENFLTGLTGKIIYNIGYCIGAMFGIFYFWNVFTTGFFQEAIWRTIVAVVIIGIGIALRFYAMIISHSNRNSDW